MTLTNGNEVKDNHIITLNNKQEAANRRISELELWLEQERQNRFCQAADRDQVYADNVELAAELDRVKYQFVRVTTPQGRGDFQPGPGFRERPDCPSFTNRQVGRNRGRGGGPGRGGGGRGSARIALN